MGESKYQWKGDEDKILAAVQSGKPEEVLYAIKWIIALRKVKVMPVSDHDSRHIEPSGKWKKERVEPLEKLVRIQSAILTLPAELRNAVLDEAENRIQCVAIQADILKAPPRKPWE